MTRWSAIEGSVARKGLVIAATVKDDTMYCGQPDLLVGVVRSVMDNAVKYTTHGRIEVELRQDRDEVEFSVTDTGQGISPVQLPRLTDRFFRGSTTGNDSQPGSGLGLSIVKEIVEWHGGSLRIDSAPETGTTIRIRLAALCTQPTTECAELR